jgi:predicted nuclease of predicted toxin-antitoxin system
LLANENVPLALVEELRRREHDVVWVRTVAPGSRDADVLGLAASERRVLLTFDKGFGEFAFKARLTRSSGIILLRVPPMEPDLLASTVAAALQSREDWRGHFSVVEEGRVRMTPLPRARRRRG